MDLLFSFCFVFSLRWEEVLFLLNVGLLIRWTEGILITKEWTQIRTLRALLLTLPVNLTELFVGSFDGIK